MGGFLPEYSPMICPSKHTRMRSDISRISSKSALVVDEAGRADVQTTGGMGGHQQHGIGLKLAGQNDLLLVAAGQAAHVLLH